MARKTAVITVELDDIRYVKATAPDGYTTYSLGDKDTLAWGRSDKTEFSLALAEAIKRGESNNE